MKCFLCPDEMNSDNNSKEHIFLNCIGGRKTVSNFICKTCNSKTGQNWDSEIDKNLSSLALLFRIVRHRGEVKSQKVVAFDGEEYYIHKDGISSDKLEHEIVGDQLIVKGHSKVRVEQYKEKIVKDGTVTGNIDKGVFRKEKESLVINYRQDFHIPPLCSGFSKSVVKSAVAFLASESFDTEICNLAKNYLVSGGECCIDYGYEYEFIGERPFGVPFHYIRVFNQGAKIYAYYEMYGFIRYMISLSDQYIGGDILFSYAINPHLGKDIDLHCHGLVRGVKSHPAKLQRMILNEFDFVNGFRSAFFLNMENITDDCCLVDDRVFNKLFLEPAMTFAAKNLKGIERSNSAMMYIRSVTPYLMKDAIEQIKDRMK